MTHPPQKLGSYSLPFNELRNQPVPQQLPDDQHAERGVIGCWLRHWKDDNLDPAWFTDERLLLMFLAVDAIDANGELIAPKNRYEFIEQREIGRANAELASYLIERCNLWDFASDVRQLFGACLGEVTQPQMVDWYVRRMKEVFFQRREIWSAEERLREAWSEVSACR